MTESQIPQIMLVDDEQMILSVTMLAALITPWIFWAGAGAVGIPILIHLLAKRRFRRCMRPGYSL